MYQLGQNQRAQRRSSCGLQSAAHPENGGKGAKGTNPNEYAPEHNPSHESIRKEALLRPPGRFGHCFRLRRFQPQRNGRETVCHQIYQQQLRGEQHHRHSHKDSQKHGEHFPDVAGEQIADKLPDIGIDTASLLHRIHQRGKVVICEHHIRRLTRHIRAIFPHCHTYICLFDCRRIVYAVSGHGHNFAPAAIGAH